jgi:hypothetical protein
MPSMVSSTWRSGICRASEPAHPGHRAPLSPRDRSRRGSAMTRGSGGSPARGSVPPDRRDEAAMEGAPRRGRDRRHRARRRSEPASAA